LTDFADLAVPFDKTHHRRIAGLPLPETPSLVISPFHLSTLPTPSARSQHITSLLGLESEYLILIDRATPEGWAAISSARAQILAQSESTSEEERHIIAPCPHEQTCPLANDETRDTCRFSQRLQTPETMRKTKHSKRGDEDLMYSYVVFRRGSRPLNPSKQMGRKGGVARELERIEMMKQLGKVELKEVHDGEFEFVQEYVPLRVEDAEEKLKGDRENPDEVAKALQAEAYHWPRLVLPPLKRTGHVIMDACHPIGTGQIAERTNSR
jgi:ribosomal protein RSM22 (predicted rRNA methylase)